MVAKSIVVAAFVVALALPSASARAQEAAKEVDLGAIAREVGGTSGSVDERTRRIVRWINTTFEWSYTDYQKRTVQEIVRRRAGNCAELASVLYAMLDAAGVRARWMAEINVQPRNEDRQATAAKMVAGGGGNRASVFGLRHNDHRWLEVYDDATSTWFPADPAVGVVGMHEWIAARLKFGDRPVSPVPAIAETSREMLVPFVVLVLEARGGKPVENRTRLYVVEAFDAFYGGKLHDDPVWSDWVRDVDRLSVLASGAFAGETNLHKHADLVEAVARDYDRLTRPAPDSSPREVPKQP